MKRTTEGLQDLYPEKNRIQEREVFPEGYTHQKNSREEQILLSDKTNQ